MDETDPEESFLSDTPEAEGRHSISGEDENRNEEEEVQKGVGFAQQQEEKSGENQTRD